MLSVELVLKFAQKQITGDGRRKNSNLHHFQPKRALSEPMVSRWQGRGKQLSNAFALDELIANVPDTLGDVFAA
ncbi:hypothetical protein BXY39_2527 [Eilatimonas milleporae]|uniref:Uncharacterized protein n=1 Tax=Eilatimonas milleporae TaxID=911205 RepID=A0A3M0CNV6_9PROT|nr:hypothetical protein BXY39_2527 [Eilatimonas milleporae]